MGLAIELSLCFRTVGISFCNRVHPSVHYADIFVSSQAVEITNSARGITALHSHGYVENEIFSFRLRRNSIKSYDSLKIRF